MSQMIKGNIILNRRTDTSPQVNLEKWVVMVGRMMSRPCLTSLMKTYPKRWEKKMDTSGIEPDPSRNSATMLSERDKPTTPCTRWITS